MTLVFSFRYGVPTIGHVVTLAVIQSDLKVILTLRLKSGMADIAAPVRVSPVIRFGRWSLLGAGILYGLFHQNRLSKKEAAFREVDSKRRAILNEKLAIEKKRATDEEMRGLETMMSTPKS